MLYLFFIYNIYVHIYPANRGQEEFRIHAVWLQCTQWVFWTMWLHTAPTVHHPSCHPPHWPRFHDPPLCSFPHKEPQLSGPHGSVWAKLQRGKSNLLSLQAEGAGEMHTALLVESTSVCNLSSKKTVSPTPHSCSTPLDTLLDSLLDDCIHHFAPHTDITFSPQPPKWLMTWPCSSLRKCPQGQVANLKHRAGSIAEGALRTKAAYHMQSPREGHTCYSARWSWPWSGPAWVANKWILFKSIGRFRFCCRTSWF